MIEELFRIGPIAISPFGAMLVLALMGGYWLLARQMIRRGIGDQDDASAIVFACGFAGILGGKIYYAILVGDWYTLIDRAGIVWYGSLIAGVAAFFWALRQRRLPAGPTLDAAAPALAFGYGVGRIGCFLVGDDYGIPTDLPWGVAFKVGLPPSTAANLRYQFGVEVDPQIADATMLAVHPTQLYTTFASFGICIFALWLAGSRKLRPGALFLIVMALMSVERFLVEILRAKDDRFFGVFTVAQLISVVILVIVAILWRRLRQGAEGDA
ncbi:MAG: prolipoprotein diacylglyceryl transferase [Acidobacteriota bacterium]